MSQIQHIDFAHDEATAEGMQAIRFMAQRLQEARENPFLRAAVSAQLKVNHLLSPAGSKEIMEGSAKSSPKRGRSSSRESSMSAKRKDSSSPRRGTPIPRNRDTCRGLPSRRGRSRSPPSEDNYEQRREEASDSEVAPRRRHPQRSPVRQEKRRRNHSPDRPSQSVRYYGEPNHGRRRRNRESPSPPPSSSPSTDSYPFHDVPSPVGSPRKRGHRRLHAA